MLEKLALTDCFGLFTDLYTPKILLDVNDCRVLLVKICGDNIPWHSHDDDEVFWVISGNITIWTREESVKLGPGELFKVPKGIEHRVTSGVLSEIALIESNTFKHTGVSESDITKHRFDYLLNS